MFDNKFPFRFFFGNKFIKIISNGIKSSQSLFQDYKYRNRLDSTKLILSIRYPCTRDGRSWVAWILCVNLKLWVLLTQENMVLEGFLKTLLPTEWNLIMIEPNQPNQPFISIFFFAKIR